MEQRVTVREPIAATLPEIATQLDGWHVGGCKRLVLDLTGLHSIDSLAIGHLVRMGVRCKKSGIELFLHGASPMVRRFLEQAGVTHFLRVEEREPPPPESPAPLT